MTTIKIEDRMKHHEQVCIRIGNSCLIRIIIRKKE